MPRDAFLMYVDDWLSSGRIELMDAHEERGYLRLLLRAWKQPDCALPTDDVTLSSWSKMGLQWFRETAEKTLRVPGLSSGMKVRACFIEANGRLFNERQHREWDYQQAYLANQIANGKRGGRPKKEPKPNPEERVGLSLGSFRVNPNETQTEPNSKPGANPEKPNLNLKPETKSKAEKASPKSGEARRGKRFDFAELPADWLEFAVLFLKWDENRAQRAFVEFGDYWRGVPGQKGTKTDWLATWRNRCRELDDRGRATPTLFPTREGIAEQMMRVATERIAKGERI